LFDSHQVNESGNRKGQPTCQIVDSVVVHHKESCQILKGEDIKKLKVRLIENEGVRMIRDPSTGHPPELSKATIGGVISSI
jgi:hypothetical protein